MTRTLFSFGLVCLLTGCHRTEIIEKNVSFTVTADESFVHSEPVEILYEGVNLVDSEAPSGVTITMKYGIDTGYEPSVFFEGILSSGTYEAMVQLSYQADSPNTPKEFWTVTIRSE